MKRNRTKILLFTISSVVVAVLGTAIPYLQHPNFADEYIKATPSPNLQKEFNEDKVFEASYNEITTTDAGIEIKIDQSPDEELTVKEKVNSENMFTTEETQKYTTPPVESEQILIPSPEPTPDPVLTDTPIPVPESTPSIISTAQYPIENLEIIPPPRAEDISEYVPMGIKETNSFGNTGIVGENSVNPGWLEGKIQLHINEIDPSDLEDIKFIIKKLDQEWIKALSKNGFTPDEQDGLKTHLHENLSDDEYILARELFYEYGNIFEGEEFNE